MYVHFSILSEMQGLLGQQNFKWTLRREEEGGGGSYQNIQFMLSGEKVNMSVAPNIIH